MSRTTGRRAALEMERECWYCHTPISKHRRFQFRYRKARPDRGRVDTTPSATPSAQCPTCGHKYAYAMFDTLTESQWAEGTRRMETELDLLWARIVRTPKLFSLPDDYGNDFAEWTEDEIEAERERKLRPLSGAIMAKTLEAIRPGR